MTLIQRLIMLLPKAWSDDIRADSEKWILTCSKCGTERSIWDIGGVRYKAYSRGKVTVTYCTTCRALRTMTVVYKKSGPVLHV